MNTQKVLKGMPEFLEMESGQEKRETDTHPHYLMMNLETNCPLNCLKCAFRPANERKMGKPLSFAERKNILQKAAAISIKELVIIGSGEPSTLKNFQLLIRPLIKAAHDLGLGTVLFTTGIGLNKEQAEFYRDHDVTVIISLDSLNPAIYRNLTGIGNLVKVMENIRTLRNVYKETQLVLPDGKKLVRLAINTTIQKDNFTELDSIREFAGNDMQFIANEPIPQGRLRAYKNWEKLVGDKLEIFRQLAQEKSDTGRHSSVTDGVCGYFHKGISVDTDGELLSCAYAAESASSLGNVRAGVTSELLLAHYQKIRKKYSAWREKIGRLPSCPLRDKDYKNYIHSL